MEGIVKNVEVISVGKDLECDKARVPEDMIMDLRDLIEYKFGGCGGGRGLILDLGDLKWLAEQPTGVGISQKVVSEVGREAVVEMGKLVAKFGGGRSGMIWLIGTATCETYLRCQVYHPSMENDWDLQAIPIASKSPLSGMLPRIGTNVILSSSTETLSPSKIFPIRTSIKKSFTGPCCSQCSSKYDQELASAIKELEETNNEAYANVLRPTLPQWLQNAKVESGEAMTFEHSQIMHKDNVLKQKRLELHKKWSTTCLLLHPIHHQNLISERLVPKMIPMAGFNNPTLFVSQPVKLESPKHLQESLTLRPLQEDDEALENASLPSGSPVRTELVLGPTKEMEFPRKVREDSSVQDLLGCITSEVQFQKTKFGNETDANSFKKLLTDLMRKAWWQPGAASELATIITQRKFGERSRQGGDSKGSLWLLFTGPDRVGKKKIASVLAEHIYCSNPIMIYLGTRREEEENLSFRGKTSLDRIAEAVRQNPFAVIMLVDIDEADMFVCGSIERAMERGKLADSYGREVSLGNVIFILTGNWFTVNHNDQSLEEMRLGSLVNGSWQLRLTLGEKAVKRRAHWLLDKDRVNRQRKELGSGLSLDLNLAADADEDSNDGSVDSCDISTIDQEDDHGFEDRQYSTKSVPRELANSSDAAIVFKPVDFSLIRLEIEKTITKAFTTTMDNTILVEIEPLTLDRIVGGFWFGRTSLEEWEQQVLIPSFHQLKARLTRRVGNSLNEKVVVRLDSCEESPPGSPILRMPQKITVAI